MIRSHCTNAFLPFYCARSVRCGAHARPGGPRSALAILREDKITRPGVAQAPVRASRMARRAGAPFLKYKNSIYKMASGAVYLKNAPAAAIRRTPGLFAFLAFMLAQGGRPCAAATLDGIQTALGDAASKNDIARVVLIVAFILLLGAILAIWRYYREQAKKLTPLGWITSQKQIRQILNSAVRTRSTFELQFPHRGVQRRPILRCVPYDTTPDEIILEAEGIKNIARNWTERAVNCYFKINVKGQHVYYAFSTRIKRVEIRPRGRCTLVLHTPERMENRQKRAFLRIMPPKEYMLGGALWIGRHMPALEDLPHMERWTKPAMVLLPGKGREQFEISDISAGGLRLTIPRKEMIMAGLELSVAEQLVLIMDLLNPDDRSRLRFWLHCRVQNFAAQYDTHNIEAGLQFLAWAMPKEDKTELEWFKLNRSHEVDPLGNWIIRRHLELFRDAPEADALRQI